MHGHISRSLSVRVKSREMMVKIDTALRAIEGFKMVL